MNLFQIQNFIPLCKRIKCSISVKKLNFINFSSFLVLLFLSIKIFSQNKSNSISNIATGLAWWDLQHYDLSMKINPEQKFISGKNTITYKVISKKNIIRVDLKSPISISKVIQDSEELKILKKENAYFIQLKKEQIVGNTEKVTILFKGNPKVSKNPPWDGGFTWKKDKYNFDFIATNCQGEEQGCSIWWPCKNNMYDEPNNGIDLKYTVPENLVAVGNGRLVKTTHQKKEKTKTYHWNVYNPINNYGVHLSIGNYVNYNEDYFGINGILNCSYFILKQNFEKAKKQFKEVKRTLEAFEYWFGPYPFYEDGYKLVEVPYLGMEHQSSISYGNRFKNGYVGKDLSLTGWGFKFDFIIVHETGHEWFGNNITNKNIADMWIHESFASYSESLFLEYHYGKKAANEYTIGLRKKILNDKPIVSMSDLNKKGSNDMYFKGSNMLHTIRQIIDDDANWLLLLREINRKFYHQTVDTKEFETFISDFSKIDFSTIFDQYLRTVQIPLLEYKTEKKHVKYRWKNTVYNLKLPIRVCINSKKIWIKPTKKWQKIKGTNLMVDPNFYIYTLNLSKK